MALALQVWVPTMALHTPATHHCIVTAPQLPVLPACAPSPQLQAPDMAYRSSFADLPYCNISAGADW